MPFYLNSLQKRTAISHLAGSYFCDLISAHLLKMCICITTPTNHVPFVPVTAQVPSTIVSKMPVCLGNRFTTSSAALFLSSSTNTAETTAEHLLSHTASLQHLASFGYAQKEISVLYLKLFQQSPSPRSEGRCLSQTPSS